MGHALRRFSRSRRIRAEWQRRRRRMSSPGENNPAFLLYVSPQIDLFRNATGCPTGRTTIGLGCRKSLWPPRDKTVIHDGAKTNSHTHGAGRGGRDIPSFSDPYKYISQKSRIQWCRSRIVDAHDTTPIQLTRKLPRELVRSYSITFKTRCV